MASAIERGPSHALTVRGHDMQQQGSMLVHFMGIEIEAADRIDLSVDAILTVHRFQILIQLKLAGLLLGFPLNFNVPILRQDIQKLVL